MVRDDFDGYRRTYEETVNNSIAFSGLKVEFFVRAKAVRLLDLLARTLGPTENLSVLDVGCGVGAYHGLLKKHIGNLSGVDPSHECVAEAKANNVNVEYRGYDGRDIPYPDAVFDAAFAICVVHHVPTQDWVHFFSEMKRVVRPGGLVVIFEHNPHNPLTMRAVSNCPFDADAVLLSMQRLKKLMGEAGLRDLEGRYILSIPSIGGLLRKVDNILGWIPMGAQYYVVAEV